jgi:hypothetical protein
MEKYIILIALGIISACGGGGNSVVTLSPLVEAYDSFIGIGAFVSFSN